MINQYDQPNIVLLPGWIYRSLKRNKVNTIDSIDYSTLRQHLSLDDMAFLFSMNLKFRLNGEMLSTNSLPNVIKNISNEQQIELDRSIYPLANSINIYERLLDVNSMTESYYEIINSQNCIFIIINEGFLKYIEDKQYLMDFIRDYLKSCYTMKSIAEVSYLGLFKLYLSLL